MQHTFQRHNTAYLRTFGRQAEAELRSTTRSKVKGDELPRDGPHRLQVYHFSGNLEMSGNASKVRERSGNFCSQGNLIVAA